MASHSVKGAGVASTEVPSALPIDAIEQTSSDSDSGYEEKTLSTSSVTSSIYAFDIENGRKYQAGKSYVIPNDEAEQERMDIHYHSLRYAMGDKLFHAPMAHPTSVIDVGTGTGIWALDMADAYPGAHVLGIDLSPIQPTWVAPNLEFRVFDLEETWDMPNRFDFIHTREMNGFSIKSWPKFYEQAFQSMRPGGWVECQEFDLDIKSDDNTIPPDSAVIRWQNLWEEGIQKGGMTGRCYPNQMANQMREAGFINVHILPFKMPIGAWAKDPMLRQSGLCTLVGLLDGVFGLSVRVYTQLLGWSVEELEALLAQCRSEWKNKRIHSYFPMYVLVLFIHCMVTLLITVADT
ncbi:uncharacterized protein Z518_04907 [Rhinocladiella mackenziei CBS 650.93]|uniref:S-adenosyl-L-methionine-dependent methyltransferase n=1 Tax=Rhinocladiella mackenziei CBS 650.93 TaxID=1442369 RepID=A0A0D2IUU4_9EURO|nr:uncharacterized protein Z518_04907 [Rhinocladiella mackenziei CBS 650.93]KIX06931.1 hypothetical protein Z518_04907 [Rhinocladiella mackenziei CBS 650.93]